ncbi:hypothetical protein KDK95_29215 [Actinospica sp. MGRD01-02]|uniref:Uncharacterized protein n=1 Tax=Actinospica acidithermotolerans TaxID=2828514 RepID=A0A941EFB6_9ACTN|nr:hypothetical protein [Actinospica acidithermotolerans]MBR7830416.1 hypothetical protein [Actinospica acidithermotolerans]
MPRAEFSAPLIHGQFREKRVNLSDEAFAYVEPGDGTDDPTDLIEPEVWENLMDLPTDVLLRTTDHFGTKFREMQNISSMWLDVITPVDGVDPPLVFAAYLDAYDALKAAPFVVAHGWYQQATGGLRNALEVMTHAANCIVRGKEEQYEKWRDGSIELKFANSVDNLERHSSTSVLGSSLPPGTMYGKGGVIRQLYRELCHFAHGSPGHTNADMWASNGPVFVPEAFGRFWGNYRDTFLACSLLLKTAYSDMQLPADLTLVAQAAGQLWNNLAERAVASYFTDV